MSKNDLKLAKLPPQALEAEKSLIGALLAEKEALRACKEYIEDGSVFYTPKFGMIYDAILETERLGYQVDLVTIIEVLRKRGELEKAGGDYELMEMMAAHSIWGHAKSHALMVKQKHIEREVIRVCGEAITEAYSGDTDVFDLLAETTVKLRKLSDVSGKSAVKHISTAVFEQLKNVQERIENKVEFTGVPTGHEQLDKLTGGLQPDDFVILAARPAVGKTAFVLNLAVNAAKSTKKECTVMFFSLEMSAAQLANRVLASSSQVALQKISKEPKTLHREELEAMGRAAMGMKNVRLHIDDTAIITPQHIYNVVSGLKKQPDMIVIDYLQLMKPNYSEKNRERDVASISRDLKILAKTLHIPIVALSQLNREGDGEPELKNIRESGAIEQDADTVLFLYGVDTQIILKVGKHRGGELDKIPFDYDKTTQTFREANIYGHPQTAEYYNLKAGIQNRGYINTSEPFKND